MYAPPLTPDFRDEVFRNLSDNRTSADNIPDHRGPGVYAIFARNPDVLPDIVLPPSRLVYIGQSSNLKNRNPFTAKYSDSHSLRRSIGAILKTKLHLTAIPRPTDDSKEKYSGKFRFGDDGERRLSQWMTSNLEVSIYPFDHDAQQLETLLICGKEPPLNLTGWINPQSEKIRERRKVCREEARRVWEERQ